ncbi:hypothetical protein Taro_032197 [Colocasia esculenta]|uniref:Secreted protein n=1 Tax=Colocasia esculenta TaxID=4460 RepID=A0A843VU52_COLES|nr:hypothetical protein [Colocasia esculenta]
MLVVSVLRVLSGYLVQAPICCFSNPFLGAVRGGTGVCSSLTSWHVQGGSVCGPLTLWRLRWLCLVVRRHSHLGRDSLSQEFVAGRSWWRFVAPCVASSNIS